MCSRQALLTTMALLIASSCLGTSASGGTFAERIESERPRVDRFINELSSNGRLALDAVCAQSERKGRMSTLTEFLDVLCLATCLR